MPAPACIEYPADPTRCGHQHQIACPPSNLRQTLEYSEYLGTARTGAAVASCSIDDRHRPTDLTRRQRRTRMVKVSERRSLRGSVDAQIPVDFPRRHVPDVVVPLFALRRQEVFEQVLAECFAHEVVLLELIERLAQVAGQFVNPKMPSLAVTH